MTKAILKTDKHAIERELQALNEKRTTFQPILDAMIENDFLPTTVEFQNIVWGKANNEKDGLLLFFLQSKMVAKTDAIDRLPIKEEAKRNMIELPKSCDVIFKEFAKLSTRKDVLIALFKFEIDENGKLQTTAKAKQAIIDSNTLYGEDIQVEALNDATGIVKAMRDFTSKYGVGVLSKGIVQQTFDGDYKVNELAISFNVK